MSLSDQLMFVHYDTLLTDNKALRGVSTGSVLVAVDGETLTPENYTRLLEKLRVWTIASVDEGDDDQEAVDIASDPSVPNTRMQGDTGDEEGQKTEAGSMEGEEVPPVVPDDGAEQGAMTVSAEDSAIPPTLPGSTEPLKPDELMEDGEPSLGPALAFAEHDAEPIPAAPSPLPPPPPAVLRLTFRLLSPDQVGRISSSLEILADLRAASGVLLKTASDAIPKADATVSRCFLLIGCGRRISSGATPFPDQFAEKPRAFGGGASGGPPRIGGEIEGHGGAAGPARSSHRALPRHEWQ